MIKILFICHGNICRSPMAEFIFRDMVNKQGLEAEILCASAAVSTEEIGNGIYPAARRKLAEMGVPFTRHAARQVTKADYADYDFLLCMDGRNIIAARALCGGDPEGKIRRLAGFTSFPRDIADPWYTDDFDLAARDITDACGELLAFLRREYHL